MQKILITTTALLLTACAMQEANTSNTALNVCLTQKANAAIQDGTAFTTPIKTLAQNISKACLKQLALEKTGMSEEALTATVNVLTALKAANASS